MIALLLDSSNKNLSVALSQDGNVLRSREYDAWQQQSELMIPEIDNILKEENLSTKDINAIVVAIGPGSYTGVRIAVTIAKIMGFLLNVNVYQVSSLEVMKDTLRPTICLLNARSNRSYIGVYAKDTVILADTIMTNKEVKAYMTAHPDYLVAGDLSYLGIKGIESNRFTMMANSLTDTHLVTDLLALKPIYLKD